MSGSSGESSSDGKGFTPQQRYNFNARVLLTAVVILLVLIAVFVLIRVLLYHLVVPPGGGGRRPRRGLAAGILRSINSLGGGVVSGRHGLDASALSALPVTSYRKEKGDGAAPGGAAGAATVAGADCAVCLSEIEDGEKVRELPNCGHVFHVECVDAWLRSRTTCPLCRAEAELGVREKGKDKAEAAQSSSSAAPPLPPALFGAGGTLVLTIQVAQARGSTSRSAQSGAS